MTSVPLEVFDELFEERHARLGLGAGHPPAAEAPRGDEPRPALGDVRAVAFDLDATLVDFIAMKRRQCRATARAMVRAGLPGAVDAVADALLEACYAHGIDWDGIVEIFLIDHQGHVDPDIAEAGNAAWERAARRVAPYPRVRETLRALRRRGYRLALVTDAPGHKARERLAATGLGAYFEHVLTPDDHPRGKADARPFRDLLDRWGLAPGEVAMVGDNPARDVRHAKRLGMPTVLARYGLQPAFASDLPQDQAHAVVDGAGELLELLPPTGPAGGTTGKAADGTSGGHQTLMPPHDYPDGRLTAWSA